MIAFEPPGKKVVFVLVTCRQILRHTAHKFWSAEPVSVKSERGHGVGLSLGCLSGSRIVREIEIDGVLRDLSHLDSFVVTLAGKGRDGADLRVVVHLGLHTISRACQPGDDSDLQDENGQPRVFCEERYAFSFGLRDIATRMIQEKYFCWKSFDRNRAINYAVLDAAPSRVRQLQDGEHQVIFFYLYPSDGERGDVDLYVTSCHLRYVRFGNIKRRFDTHMLLKKCHFEQKRLP